MKEDIGITGDDYNYVMSLWEAGYVVGVIPSQILILKIRPSIWFPCAEMIWAILTFCTSRVTNVNQLYAIRFLIGFFESPFYMGALSLLSNWYDATSLSKRACILYAASNVASMVSNSFKRQFKSHTNFYQFSGYLQAGIYTNLDGNSGFAGWQWLFIVCGAITIPLSLFGLIAIPDNPLKPNKFSFWLTDEEKNFAAKRYRRDRVQFHGFKLSEVKTMILDWPFYVLIFSYTSYMIFTNAMGYFTLYIQSLGKYSVAEINNIPTSAQAVALVGTLLLGWLSDWKGRYLALQIALAFNLVSCIFLLIYVNETCIWIGYMISGISWVYGPIMLTWSQEFLRRSEFESKFTIGVAQASAIANLIWATIILWSTDKQYPYYKAAYIVSLILTVVQIPLSYYMNVLVHKHEKLADVTDVNLELERSKF
ncbi:uncharacterized protein PRCAT00001471001 [Priceomyces carsonii]|uniref:uncharacterized protein n=1 Tax=Priceomyces carsonii TaxID=28549 RepID=UPI002ED8BDFC|nr:unnamed protein product [Priceomyces carsonii]